MHILAGEGLARDVQVVHIGGMTQLATWMAKNKLKDPDLAEKAKGKVSRSQISRIRRGKSGASPETARVLASLTGMPWHTFIGGEA
jgi:hypothetical protein